MMTAAQRPRSAGSWLGNLGQSPHQENCGNVQADCSMEPRSTDVDAGRRKTAGQKGLMAFVMEVMCP
ncbi:hypothetical protein ACFXKH_39790, partial [Streptomyces caelestis]|uniref:hypothetical protein n=1 Tax=Streptomyces caelestis TaxID=36816 RepID=UPI00368DA1F5